jgi:hypothetical protein
VGAPAMGEDVALGNKTRPRTLALCSQDNITGY